ATGKEMKILVTGSSGLVGSALVRALAGAGHTVCRLVRPQGEGTSESPGGFNVNWNPVTGELGGAAVGADAVVNLAGASIADERWTAERKEVLRTSRIDTTRALIQALAKMNARPAVLVSASAIGIYGSRGDELLTEESTAGTNFLAGLAREWEAEALKAEALGIRVVLARFGIILAREGGALPKMMVPFKFGAGGRIGDGKQWMSWVALEDVVGILRFAIEKTSVRGAVNIVAPQPLQNAEFTKVLAKAMHRPALFPAPPFALRLALGEMADALLLASQRVVPRRLKEAGYKFSHPELPAVLNQILNAN
ncbi:MAG TPA: TIGR01777 family oxidoreductase, partial [Candidatus Acidoferrum sp.]|nr:TIGR01777 family oxidoreductase [Candidatus Acidoferrum sp.]